MRSLRADLRAKPQQCPEHPKMVVRHAPECSYCAAYARHLRAVRRDEINAGVTIRGTRIPERRAKPEQCPTHPRMAITHAKSCAYCRAYVLHGRAVRRDQVKAEKPARPLAKIDRVPRCRAHSKRVRGCPECQAWSNYQGKVRRREIQAGTLQPCVPRRVAHDYLQSLIDADTGGWTLNEISEKTGITANCLRVIRRSPPTGSVLGLTWKALSSLQPKGTPVPALPRTKFLVPSVETRRIYQGLSAQGWTFCHMASLRGYGAEKSLARLASDPNPYVTQETLHFARILRDKLGPYDVTEMDTPLPGMWRAVATRAERRGWIPIRDWDGLDIADPNAEPFRAGPDPAVTAGAVLVDHVSLRKAVVDVAENGYPNPYPSLRRFEIYALAWYAKRAGLTASDTGAMLGYPQDRPEQRLNGLRQVARLHEALGKARSWLDDTDKPEPRWITRRVSGRVDVGHYLIALLAVQPEPFGYGMTPEQLAQRCGHGITTEQIEQYLAKAATCAKSAWKAKRWVRKRRPARK